MQHRQAADDLGIGTGYSPAGAGEARVMANLKSSGAVPERFGFA
jgi:hypothetical protein